MILLTHWGWVTHKCVSKLTIIGSDNGLSPDRRQAIIWTNAGLLLIGPLVTNFSEILIEILAFSFKKMRLKVSSVKWRPFCLGLNVLTDCRSKIDSAFESATHEIFGPRWNYLWYLNWHMPCKVHILGYFIIHSKYPPVSRCMHVGPD